MSYIAAKLPIVRIVTDLVHMTVTIDWYPSIAWKVNNMCCILGILVLKFVYLKRR
jgi:hypothetical protein